MAGPNIRLYTPMSGTQVIRPTSQWPVASKSYPNPNVIITESESFEDILGVQRSRNGQLSFADILAEEHPTYKKYKGQWMDWYNWYSGEGIENYLYQHIREPTNAFQRRKKRAYYYNYTKSIISLIGSFLFSRAITRSFHTQSENIGEYDELDMEETGFLKNIDRRNTTINDYMRQVYNDAKVFGYVDVMVDMPKALEEILSEQDRLDYQLHPYVYKILPLNMINWEVDDAGNFLWVKWKEEVSSQSNPFAPRGDVHIFYTIWTREDWSKFEVIERPGLEALVNFVDGGVHGLGVVPCVRFYGEKDLLQDKAGLSMVATMGKINVSIMNYVSLLEEEIFSKCVSGDALIDCPRNLTKYPDGVPIRRLVGRSFDTYSWSRKYQRFVIRRAGNVRKTGHKKEVWKLTYKWKNPYGIWQFGALKATPDHKILLRDGSYIELEFLREGDKLVPLTRYVSELFDGYSYLYPDNTLKSKVTEHRFVVGEYEDLSADNHVHHIDSNRVNNSPKNLMQLTPSEHHSLTSREFWGSITQEERAWLSQIVSDGQKRFWASRSEAERKAHGERTSADLKQYWLNICGTEQMEVLRQQRSKNMRQRWEQMTEEEYDSYCEKMRDNARQRVWTDEQRQARSGMGNPMYGRGTSQPGPLNGMYGKTHTPEVRKKISEAAKAQAASRKMNHEVVSVEFYGYEDVYCMDVQGTHNFVANGIVVHNCLNVLAMRDPNDTGDAVEEGGNGGSQQGIEIGSNNVLLYSGDVPPQYLAPASAPGEFILAFIAKSIAEIYRIATLGSDTGVDQTKSGVSYSYEFNETNRMLADNADLLQRGEEKVLALYKRWLGESWEGYVDYPDSFDIGSYTEELRAIMDAKAAVRSETFGRELEKRLARKLLERSSASVADKIMREIDTLPEKEIQVSPRPGNPNAETHAPSGTPKGSQPPME